MGMGADFEHIHPKFRHMTLPNSWVEKLYGGMRWAEGPVWFADGNYLLWSDIPNNRIMQYVDGLGVRIWREDSNHSNGNTRDKQGRLITCEHGARRVTRTEPDGSITVLASHYQGKRLNSPNDAVVKSDGTIWFTDPPYGIMSHYEGSKTESELGKCHVFRLDPANGELSVVTDELAMPNGIAFSLDEKLLYVADTEASHNPEGAHHIRIYEVQGGKRVGKGRVFAEVSPGIADGFRLDDEGNIWTSAGDGVHCFSPQGELLGRIRVPEVVSNVAFGGPKRNRLFMTGTTSLYAAYLAVAGAMRP
jgi:gluconolactonase